MNKNYIIFIFLFLINSYKSQLNWTWINGSNTNISVNPTFGILGTPSSSNSPGSRQGSVCWTDNVGNLWLFGGLSTYGWMNDLWRYSPALNQWTWMKGSTIANQPGNYGTLGVSSISNTPGARISACGWCDNAGNLYLFGGVGYATSTTNGWLNDIWRYNTNTNNWTWLKGSSTINVYGVYGTQNVGAPLNTPGSRHGFGSARDVNGNAWIFGGEGYSSNAIGKLNDLWKYDVSTNNWTWITGASIGAYHLASYGILGVANASNSPGSRSASAMCYSNSGDLYLFAGFGPSSFILSDFWRYNIANGHWTWTSGSSTGFPFASYGVQGVPSTTNFPGVRTGTDNMFCDNNGSIWLFFGNGYDQTNNSGLLNNIWRYTISNNSWAWVKGSAISGQYGSYGTLGVPSPTNNPGGRGASIWQYGPGAFWIYGGYGYSALSTGDLSDLWRFDICQYANTPTLTTTSNSLSVCNGNSITLTALTNTGTLKWYASPGSNSVISTATVLNLNNLQAVSNPSVYTYFVQSSVSSCGANPLVTIVNITVNPTPTLSVSGGTICQGSSFTIAPSGALSYTFSNASGTITNIVAPMYSTNYSVIAVSGSGCFNSATTTVYVKTPSLNVSPTTTICLGSSITLTANGANTFTWNTGMQSQSIVVTPSLNTIYTVSGTDVNNCIFSKTVAINIFQLPIINVIASKTITCLFEQITLNASGAQTYTWTGGVSNNVPFSPTITSGYTVTGTDLNGCINNSSVFVIVNPSPTVIVTCSKDIICVGDSVVLTANGANTYSWSTGQSTNSIVTLATNSQISFSVIGTYSNGCKSLRTYVQDVELCTSIPGKNNPLLQFSVYPNPSTGHFSLHTIFNIPLTIQIFDFTGRLIFMQRCDSEFYKMDLSEYASGLYMLRIFAGNKELFKERLSKL